MSHRAILISDFDGTIARNDFYRLVLDRLVPEGTPDYWASYRAGRLTHFEALRACFAAARPDEAALVARADLADGLRARGDAFQTFGRWADVADALLAFSRGSGRCV